MALRWQKYNLKAEFPFVFQMVDIEDREEMKEWLMENIGYYNGDWIWWGTKHGNPSVYIKEAESATAFKLRWL